MEISVLGKVIACILRESRKDTWIVLDEGLGGSRKATELTNRIILKIF